MKRKWLITLMVGSLATILHAEECADMPIGTNLAKSIMGKNLDQAKKLLPEYEADVNKYLETCKDEGKQQQITIMKLTYQEELKHLEENMKKKPEASFDCSKVPDDSALKSAFSGQDKESIKKNYSEYKKKTFDYLEHCATHPSFSSVYEAALLHDEEYAEIMEN